MSIPSLPVSAGKAAPQPQPGWFDSLRRRYMRGVGVILPGLLNCFLTCVAGAFANVAFERWSQNSLHLLTQRIVVGYAGAVCVVFLVLPWINQMATERRSDRRQD